MVALLAAGCAALAGQKPPRSMAWRVNLGRAPLAARELGNPFAGQPEALMAGRKLFRQNCAECHLPDGRGQRRAPDLSSPVIRNAPPGVLFWYLRNGNLNAGMPSWSRLPDQRLWQIVTYLKSER